MKCVSALNLILIVFSFVQCDQQPNIVVFLVDDMGYNDVGFRGSNEVQTPNIDALAYNGVVLNRFYSLPTCTPSRAALLTGNYPIRSGMQGTPIAAGENRYIPWDMPTLPERLKELGYKTHLVGKWHLGYGYRNVTPTSRGFDSHYGYWNGYMGYFSHHTGPIRSSCGSVLKHKSEPVISNLVLSNRKGKKNVGPIYLNNDCASTSTAQTEPNSNSQSENEATENILNTVGIGEDIDNNNQNIEEEPSNNNEVQKSRKRKRDSSKWKSVTRKSKHDKREEYVSVRNKLVLAKRIKTFKNCISSCIYKCQTIISTADRDKIFKAYYSLSSEAKKLFLASTVQKVQTHRRRKGKCSETSRRKGFNGLDMHENFSPDFNSSGQYATDLFTERASKLINEHDYASNPLFLLISHLAPHTGELNTTTGVTVLEERRSDEMNRNFGYIEDINRRRYVDIVKSADDSLGEIIKTLSDKGVMDNTMILFMSDNGGQTFGMHENFASNWPLRGLKFTYFEGAVRGTAIFYSKDILLKGSTNDDLIHMTDWLPTFYKAGNGNTEDLGNIDGVNQLETILRNVAPNRRELLVNIDEVENYVGFISDGGRYKYINGTIYSSIYDGFYGVTGRDLQNPDYNISAVLSSATNGVLSYYRDVPLTYQSIASARLSLESKDCRNSLPVDLSCSPCLFDLANDPCETNNIADKNSDVVNYLSNKVEQFWSGLVPQQNKPFDVNSDPANFGYVWSPWLDDVPKKQKQLMYLI